jgi:glutamate-ammonia-ligase adenylyltransferase
LGLVPCIQVVQGLSILAERILKDALDLSMKLFEEKEHTAPPSFSVIGLGKFGGQELGYASDLDVMFVSFGDVGQIEHANSLGSILMDVLSKNMIGGFLYKLDARLRPDGSKGPLVQSIDTYREYYSQSNAIWERMALSRARVVAGDVKLGQQVIEIIEEFVFRSMPLLEEAKEIRDIREQIFQERCSKLPEGLDVKSGVGGLLDIEFLSQFLQLKAKDLLSGARETNTLKLLQRLSHLEFLSREELGLLVEAYLFYREVENALRLVKDRPTDFIPKDAQWVIGIQKKMGLSPDFEHFFEKLAHYSQVVRYLYDKYVRE